MEDEFLGYIGDYRVDDSRVKKVTKLEEDVIVKLKNEDEDDIEITFSGVREIDEYKPEGMILYSICEMKEVYPYRRFSFVNTDEEDESYLDIVSLSYSILIK
jgi:hypothetical protein